jgi:hypothetical protein
MSFRDVLWKTSSALGIALTASVVFLLLWLHLFGHPVVEQDAPWLEGQVVDVLVCETAPPWAAAAVPAAVEWWRRRGVPLSDARRSACGHLCPTDAEGRMVPCELGAIVVDLRDAAFSDENKDEAFSGRQDGHRVWATILMAPDLTLEDPKALPSDIETLVLAHGLGHALGFTHVKTKISGPFVSIPMGHLMNPELEKLGWRDEGLPTGRP